MAAQQSRKDRSSPRARKTWRPNHGLFLERILGIEESAETSRRGELGALAILSLALLALHVVLYRHAGAVWRDEASTIHIALAPDLATLWARLSKDSNPVLAYWVVRLWSAVVPGATAAGLRLFGSAVSVGIVASIIVSCRSITGRLPTMGVALVACNPTVFYFGSSVRAYGLAILLILPCCAAFWRVARQPTRLNVTASLVLAVLACHTSYQNSYLLLAIGLGAAGACAVCRLWRRSLLVLGICAFAAASMLVYLPATRAYRDATLLQRTDIRTDTIASGLDDAVADGAIPLRIVWIGLVLLAVACLTAQVVRHWGARGISPSLELYFLILAVVAGAAAFLFFTTSGMHPYPWHYAPLLGLTGLIVEAGLRSRRKLAWVGVGHLTAACLVLVASLTPLWGRAHLRRTNLDRLSGVLAEQAGPQDFVLVTPFWLAPGFKYHYQGRAPWDTLPLISTDLEDVLLPFTAIKRVMVRTNAIEPTLERIATTLSSGNRLWIAGSIPFLKEGQTPENLPPAPGSRFGWNSTGYAYVWGRQVAYYVQTHARSARRVTVDVPEPVNPLEDVVLMLVEGWQGP